MAQAENGKGPAPRVPPDEILRMVQNLLADRFKLAVHWEKHAQPIYALTFRRPIGRLARGCVESRSTVTPASPRFPQTPPHGRWCAAWRERQVVPWGEP